MKEEIMFWSFVGVVTVAVIILLSEITGTIDVLINSFN